jgi:Family of unknown function (DUF6452)
MRKLIPASLTVILSGLILFILSCTPESCFEETSALLKATFYKAGSNTPNTADTLTVYGIGNDSLIYDKALKVSTIKLPLDASSRTSGFVIKINEITDTLIFTYSSYPHLISKECGITFFYNLESYSVNGTKIDTIIFRNNKITNLNEENIRIFY